MAIRRSRKHYIARPKGSSFKRIRPHHIHITAATLLTIGAVIFLSTGVFVAKKTMVVHGPNPATVMRGLAETKGVTSSTATTAPASSPSPATIAKPSSSLPASGATAPALASLVTAKAYGIAAGGGLTSLSQQELDLYFTQLKELGTTWVRWDIDWNVVQPQNQTHYNWTPTDRVANTAKKYGISSLAIITYTPKWARSSACVDSPKCRPADMQAFGKFAETVASRYKSSVTHWEIWNEPNYKAFWEPRPNSHEYAELLKAAYLGIKKVSPSAIIVTGGLAASGNEEDGSRSPLTFVTGLYERGANAYYDIVALHPYTYPASTDYIAWWNSWQQMGPVRDLMIAQGEASKKIWITEYGAPTGGPGNSFTVDQFDKFTYGSDHMSENAQAMLASQAIAGYSARTDWLGPFFWYSLKDLSSNRDNPENFFGLLRSNNTKKPAYDIIYREAHSLQ
ncbi:MAG TPA: hypothetical protein VJ836_04375 [Candidatus Saccharimonadales bacterium]|nr:hypothetical protein [Candidatus Saccharimonadales bacterium]